MLEISWDEVGVYGTEKVHYYSIKEIELKAPFNLGYGKNTEYCLIDLYNIKACKPLTNKEDRRESVEELLTLLNDSIWRDESFMPLLITELLLELANYD